LILSCPLRRESQVTVPAEDDYVRPLLEFVDRQVTPLVDWYQRKKRWPRRMHKATSAAVIILGALIPIASAWSAGTAARIFVGAIGVAITTLTSLAASYDWHQRWRIFAVAQGLLETQLANWELAIAGARMLPDQEGRAEALAATVTLLEAVNRARKEETESFFEREANGTVLPSAGSAADN
jgi:uncharacterized protein DUF4231